MNHSNLSPLRVSGSEAPFSNIFRVSGSEAPFVQTLRVSGSEAPFVFVVIPTN